MRDHVDVAAFNYHNFISKYDDDNINEDNDSIDA